VQCLGKLTGLQQCRDVVRALAAESGASVAGHSEEARHALQALCETLLAGWQQAAADWRREKADGVVSAVQAWSLQQKAGNRMCRP
jgi:hypothetical protein